MALNITIPQSYIPVLKNICQERLTALADSLSKIQQEVTELEKMINDLSSVKITADNFTENNGSIDIEPYNERWPMSKKIRHVLTTSTELTLVEIVKEIQNLEPILKSKTREITKNISAVLSGDLNAVNKNFERYKNAYNEWVYSLK